MMLDRIVLDRNTKLRDQRRHANSPLPTETRVVANAGDIYCVSERPPLDRAFYDRDPREVARDLLGCILVRRLGPRILAGRITEVEAYLAEEDPANHAFRGMTRRNRSMFGPPGHAYVYTIHTHHCLNIVTEPQGVASAVLIRSLEPIEGIPLMKKHRRTDDLRLLTTGPGRLCQALAIDRSLDGIDVTVPETLWVVPGELKDGEEIVVAERVGVTAAEDLPLRYLLRGTPFVSRPPRAAKRHARISGAAEARGG